MAPPAAPRADAEGDTSTMKAVHVWPGVVTVTALLLGLAGLLATGPSTGGAERTRLTCHVGADGTCR